MSKQFSKTGITVIAMLFTFIIVGLHAQVTDQTIRFSTPRVDLLFQPPLRSGFNAEHPLEIELPQLNLAVNMMENYLQYLVKLQKVATGTRLQLFYAPGQSSDGIEQNPNLIKLSDTGMNQLLQKVNRLLSEKSTTDTAYLLENADSLLNIPDNFSRTQCDIASKLQMANISSFKDSLEPDTEIAVANADLIFSTRPFKNSNRIFVFSELNNVCSASVLLAPSRKWYANLRPTGDGRFLAFTDNNEPMVIKVGTKEPTRLFPNKNVLMMSMQWSSTERLLAGMVLDLDTQQRHFFVFDAEKMAMLELASLAELEENYLYAHPYWAPDGKKILLTTGRKITLIDSGNKKIYNNITSLPNEVAEIIWSPDSQSFAVVEIIGQVRSKTVFDDYDLRHSVLHRFRINEDFSVTEDHAQRIQSRHTIKLVSFWTQDRVLYLEGRLMSKKLNTPAWDLSKTFNAFLTPPPTKSISKEEASKIKKIEPTELPMKFLFVFRNLDGKFNNVYDAGYAHTNHAYSDSFHNLWFIGLRKPEEFSSQTSSYNLRFAPYPFPEYNHMLLTEFSASKIEKLVMFLQDYNLRIARLSPDSQKLFVLANFCGPLNIWEGNLRLITEGLSGNLSAQEANSD